MQIGLIGLGRMGGNMARRLMAGGHDVVAWDRSARCGQGAAGSGGDWRPRRWPTSSRASLPRAVWIMVPAGDPTEQTVTALAEQLQSGDTIIDGGNSHFKDDVRRAAALSPRGIHYLDVGTSGGVWGAERGYCLMIGGAAPIAARLTPIFRTLAPGGQDRSLARPRRLEDDGARRVSLLRALRRRALREDDSQRHRIRADAVVCRGVRHHAQRDEHALPENHRYDLNLAEIAEVWRRGSVVSSWLLDLAALALTADPQLGQFAGTVADSGEGRWTVQAAIDEDVPADVLTTALYVRFRSRRDHTFAEKLLSALRAQFGGHVEPPR